MNDFRKLAQRILTVALPVSVLAAGLSGCAEERKYEPKPAFSGRKASLPSVPTLPQKAKKDGDAYTVWGAIHDLRSRVHRNNILNKRISVVGYITKTNLPEAPECAVHKGGKATPPDCKAPVPTFIIGDTKDEQKDVIEVMGWASNFARIYDAIEEIDKAPKDKRAELKIEDQLWGVEIPNPLPNAGARVKVTGVYAKTFSKATGGVAANPRHGIITVEKIEYIEEPPELATLPGMKPRKPL